MPRRPDKTAALMATPEAIEQQFYEALQNGDLERLMAVWLNDDETVCVHPGGVRVVGVAAIRASFAQIFEGGPVPVAPEEVHRLHGMGCAVHHLLERLTAQTPEGPRSAWVQATNVYLKTEKGWRLAAHHASPATLEQPPVGPFRSGTVH